MRSSARITSTGDDPAKPTRGGWSESWSDSVTRYRSNPYPKPRRRRHLLDRIFTPGWGILRTSPFGPSRKFALKEFCELRNDGVPRSSQDLSTKKISDVCLHS